MKISGSVPIDFLHQIFLQIATGVGGADPAASGAGWIVQRSGESLALLLRKYGILRADDQGHSAIRTGHKYDCVKFFTKLPQIWTRQSKQAFILYTRMSQMQDLQTDAVFAAVGILFHITGPGQSFKQAADMAVRQ